MRYFSIESLIFCLKQMILVGLGSNKKNLNTMNSSIICAWISTTGHILQWHDINQPLINREVETTYISFFTVNEKNTFTGIITPKCIKQSNSKYDIRFCEINTLYILTSFRNIIGQTQLYRICRLMHFFFN